MRNEFDNDIKYRLYRSIREILHPTISKKNISDYRIIIDEDILPVRVFYPKKMTGIDKVIIYIHGNGKITSSNGNYGTICKKMVKRTNSIVIAIDYQEKKDSIESLYKDIFNTVKFIFKELERNDISKNHIIIMGDSTGGNIITGINYLNNNDINIENEVLFYPVLNTKKYLEEANEISKYYLKLSPNKEYLNNDLLNPLSNGTTPPNILILVGNADNLKNDCKEYADTYLQVKCSVLPFSEHGFLNSIDNDLEKEIDAEIKKYFKQVLE